MPEIYSFGAWLKERRNAWHLSQRELAERASCAVATIKKIEADERRPSPDLAGLLADALCVPSGWRDRFIECARGMRAVDALPSAWSRDETAGPIPVLPDQGLALVVPQPSTPFIGRTSELAQANSLLARPDCRLLTLLGPGGMGKTRLALEVARGQQPAFAQGVVFVPLAGVTDPALIPAAIAQSLHLTLSGSPAEQVLGYLRGKAMLLVLDSCEHLLEGAAWLSDLLMRAGGVVVLAASRERLGLLEEWVLPVTPLAEPQAVELFVQTARRLRHRVEPAPDDGAMLAVCRLVEHLPLAIELAASWTPHLSCDEIAARIREGIDFLASNWRNVPERHRSVQALFDHSWRLLSSDERAALMRLSVFQGSWTAGEAAPVAGADLPILAALVDKSLVQVVGHGRYTLHELICRYAADKLADEGQEVAARQRHFDTYLALAQEGERQLYGPDAVAWFARLDQEQDNFRAALAWALYANHSDIALCLVDHLSFFWWRRGYWQEAERWATAAVNQAGDAESIPFCRALFHLAWFITLQWPYPVAESYRARAMSMARRLQDPQTLLYGLTISTRISPDIVPPLPAMEEALALLDRAGGTLNPIGTRVHSRYGELLHNAGRFDEAAEQYQKSLDMLREMGNVDLIAYSIGNLGRLALHTGRLPEARGLMAESVAISRSIGNRVGLGDWLYQLGLTTLYEGEVGQAEAFLQEALDLRQEMNDRAGQSEALSALGHAALLRGDLPAAAQHVRESLLIETAGARLLEAQGRSIMPSPAAPARLVDLFYRQGLVAAAEGAYERAATWFGIADRFRSQTGHVPVRALQAAVDEAVAIIGARLAPTDFQRLWERGQNMWHPVEVLEFGLAPQG